MHPIDPQQQELIFDYCFGLSCPSEAAEAERLIGRNDEAAAWHARIQAAIAPLSYLPPEYCPDGLADRTLHRLRTEASQRGVVYRSRPRIVSLGFQPRLSNAAGIVVAAASILLIAGVLVQSSTVFRQHYARLNCAAQLGRVQEAVGLYSSDYDGFLPAVARAEGAHWSAIGQDGPRHCSNTKNPYLLLKYGYTDRPADFLCGGKTRDGAPPLTAAQIATRDDFPSRAHITYSFRLMPTGGLKLAALGARPLVADMNPHFERLEAVPSQARSLELNRVTLRLNSPNHGRCGQNVLFADGHARYSRTRVIGDGDDDIYTIADDKIGEGCRLPSCLDDTMLAP